MPPTEENYKPHEWEKPHLPNLTGTPAAYKPRGSILTPEQPPGGDGRLRAVDAGVRDSASDRLRHAPGLPLEGRSRDLPSEAKASFRRGATAAMTTLSPAPEIPAAFGLEIFACPQGGG